MKRADIIARSKRITDAVKAGEDFAEIAQREGVQKFAVYHLAERHGIFRGKRKRQDYYSVVPPASVWLVTAAREARERGLVAVAEMNEARLKEIQGDD